MTHQYISHPQHPGLSPTPLPRKSISSGAFACTGSKSYPLVDCSYGIRTATPSTVIKAIDLNWTKRRPLRTSTGTAECQNKMLSQETIPQSLCSGVQSTQFRDRRRKECYHPPIHVYTGNTQIRRKPVATSSRSQSQCDELLTSRSSASSSPAKGHSYNSSVVSSQSTTVSTDASSILQNPHVATIYEQARKMQARSFLEWVSHDYPVSDFYSIGGQTQPYSPNLLRRGELCSDLRQCISMYNSAAQSITDVEGHRILLAIRICLTDFLNNVLVAPRSGLDASNAMEHRKPVTVAPTNMTSQPLMTTLPPLSPRSSTLNTPVTPRPTLAQEAWRSLKFEILGKRGKFRESQNWRGNLQPDDRLVIHHPEPVRVAK